MRIPLFRIWYSTTYTTLLLILLLILAVTPGDTIHQSIRSKELQKLFVIGGVYLLTFLIVALIYSTRIYTNRTVLSAIPKPYVPVEEGEVGKKVRRMVAKELEKSAIIAWDSRPRDLSRDDAPDPDTLLSRPNTASSKKSRKKHPSLDATILPVSPTNPPWGHVSHPGWASPSSPDLPNLQYWAVISELPNLIEAKAVSLAPPDPAVELHNLTYPDNAPPLPDAQIVTLLQRPRTMGLRAYLARLAHFGLLNPPSLGPTFLSQYEYARFSTACLTEQEFRDIMAVFAEILNGMTALDQDFIDEARALSIASETRSLAPTESSSESSHERMQFRTPQLNRHRSVSPSSYTSSTTTSTQSPQTARTAPSHQRFDVLCTPSMRSVSETGSVLVHEVERRSPSTILPNSSTSSLRSEGSVIRLRENARVGELPYRYGVEGG